MVQPGSVERADVLLATGAAWYYSPGGVAEWRFLNGAKTDTVDRLLFGDFDGDGRTDILAKNGRNLMVSWGGASDWEKINEIDAPISDLAVGNFVGDQRADIFYADGQQWFVSDAGVGPFVPVQTSSFRVRNLRFGDFDGDGRTDVLGVVSGAWMVSYSAASNWILLRPRLTDTVDNLVVADFDGDGRADVATSSPILGGLLGWNWMFSHNGVGDWASHRITPTGVCSNASVALASAAGIGFFLGTHKADVLLWQDRDLCIVPGGMGAAQRQSRQEMR
jgi:hypothetical protein